MGDVRLLSCEPPMTDKTTTRATRKPAAPKKTAPAGKAAAPRRAASTKAVAGKAAPLKKQTAASAAPFEDEVPFTRLQMKLMVVDQLMEEGVIPPFKLSIVEKAVGKKLYVGANWVMPEDGFFGMQPEVRDWFWHRPLKKEWVARIESLIWGPGAPTMEHVAPYWDGEDTLFDLTVDDAADVKLLPNLKKLSALFNQAHAKKIKTAFAKQGVTLKHDGE